MLPVVGNNDVYPDYNMDVSDVTQTLAQLAQSWAPLLQSDEERSTVARGGFLQREVAPGLIVASLNTLLYSRNGNSHGQADPLGQFAWLSTVLQNASQAHKTVYIAGHIPPIIDACEWRRKN